MSDRIAIVTGTSSGIGEAVTDALLSRGWTVVGIARRPVTTAEPGYRHLQHDLASMSDDAEQEVHAALTEQRWARMGLVNNAASPGQMRALEALDRSTLMKLLALNAAAPLALMGVCLRACSPGTPLRIVNVSSGAAVDPFPGLADYCASKAALRMAGQVLGTEVQSTGRDVGILSYEPGLVDTAMHREARARPQKEFPSSEAFHEFHRAGLLVPPAEVVAPVVAFLKDDGPPGFSERRFPA